MPGDQDHTEYWAEEDAQRCPDCGCRVHPKVTLPYEDRARWIRRLTELNAGRSFIACVLGLHVDSPELVMHHANCSH